MKFVEKFEIIEVHQWAIILRFLPTIWLFQLSVSSSEEVGFFFVVQHCESWNADFVLSWKCLAWVVFTVRWSRNWSVGLWVWWARRACLAWWVWLVCGARLGNFCVFFCFLILSKSIFKWKYCPWWLKKIDDSKKNLWFKKI